MTDLNDVQKALGETIEQKWNELQAKYDAEMREVRAYGQAAKSTQEAITKLNAEIDKLQQTINSIEKSLTAGPVNPGTPQSEAKSLFFKTIRYGRDILSPSEIKSIVADATGTLLIPPDLEREIILATAKENTMLNLVDQRTTTSNIISYRSLTDPTASWGVLETGSTVTESSGTPSKADINIEDLNGLTKLGMNELADTDAALENTIIGNMGRVFGNLIDTAIIKGEGHALGQPTGLFNGTTIARVNTAQNAAVKIEDFLDLVYTVPSVYRRNGVFVMKSGTEAALRKLKAQDGQFLWQPSIQAGRPNMFLGYPIYTQDDIDGIPTAGTAADVAIFGDLRAAYCVYNRTGMTFQRLTEKYVDSGQIGLLFKQRLGGGVKRPDAARILKVIA